jgi:hypothetical protein
LDIDNRPYLRFGETDFREDHNASPHPVMMQQVLNQLGIEYEKVKGKTGLLIPAPFGEKYNLCGAGRSRLTLERKQVVLMHESFAYSIETDLPHLERIRPLLPEWTLRYYDIDAGRKG